MTTPTRCHCNPNHDKFHLYLIQLVVIFLNVCLWRHSLRSNLGGIDPEKLYLATFICQYTLYCCIVWPSFLFVNDCFVNIWATCDNFLGKWLTAPSGKKLPVRLCPFFITKPPKYCTNLPLDTQECSFFSLACLEVLGIERGDQEKVLTKPLFFLRFFFPNFAYV